VVKLTKVMLVNQ